MAHVGVLQHFWCEDSGVLGPALEAAGHQVQTVLLFEDAPVPPSDAFDAWIIMGGPMNVEQMDDYAWLAPERRLIVELVADDRPIMGVCLGAQLIAAACGARVYAKRPKEIGLFDIELTPAASDDPLFRIFSNPQEVFQWHGDTFDLPPSAVQLARSERYEQQAFRIGRRVYGLQFHVDCTEKIFKNLCQEFSHELAALSAHETFEQFTGRLLPALQQQNRLGREMILHWANLFD